MNPRQNVRRARPVATRTPVQSRGIRFGGAREQASDESSLGRKHKPDYMLLVLALLLLGISIVVIYAIGPGLAAVHGGSDTFYVNRQLLAIVLSLVVFAVVATIPLDLLKRSYKPLLIFAGIATLIALVTPTSADYDAARWVRLGSFSFQSVELLKFALLVWFALLLGRYMNSKSSGDSAQAKLILRYFVGILAVTGIIVTIAQDDLGSTVVIIGMLMAMALAAGLPMKRLFMIGGVVLLAGVIAIAATPYRRDRITTFLNPEANCQEIGYQMCNAHIAVGSGGLIGQGLGNGAQAYGYLPEAENDAIFAVYAEKFGFIGVSVLIGIFIGFFARMSRIAERTRDPFARLLVVGILAWLGVQTIMNIGAMVGLLPLKGITLPLVSYGGTSVVFIMMAVGVVFNVSRYSQHRLSLVDDNESRGLDEDRSDRRRVRGAYRSSSRSGA